VAFTGAEKVQIRMYTGWGNRFTASDDALEQALYTTENDPDVQDLVRAQLTELARIDAAITAAESRLKAAVVGSIKLNDMEIDQLRSRGRQIAARLCRAIGVEARADAFDVALPTQRESAGGMVSGGNYSLHG
jgi:hypothetical protein